MVIKTNNIINYKHIFTKTQKELLQYLPQKLRKSGYLDIVKNNKYIYAKGNTPIMLVAHLDTVFYETPNKIFYDEKQGVLWSPNGLGADDRAGVIGILEIISTLKKSKKQPFILFTTDEEIGGIGADIASKQIKTPKVNLIIEIDRKGIGEAVFYDCDNKSFQKYIESFGFKTNWGSFSDICLLCPKWGIAGVNLSAGYYLAHTKTEYLVINDLVLTIEKVLNIIDNLPQKKFKYIKRKYNKKDKRYSKFDSIKFEDMELEDTKFENLKFQISKFEKDDDSFQYYFEDSFIYNDNFNLDYNEDNYLDMYSKKDLTKYGYFRCNQCGEIYELEEKMFIDNDCCIDCWHYVMNK